MVAPELWLLADSRLPTGGHAHSGGIEAAVRRGLVTGPDDVAAWLAGRVPTAGLVTAAAAAAACALVTVPVERRAPSVDLLGHGRPSPDPRPSPATWRGAPTGGSTERGGPSLESGDGDVDWARWDAAISARTPVAALRDVSRQQGRAMLRTVRAAWPHAPVDGLGARPHQALVLGVATRAAGGTPHDAAALAVHHLTGQVCSAAVRLLGLDPLALAGVHARALAAHGPVVGTAAEAGTAAAAARDPDLLPTATTPWPEVLAVLHARSEGALFAS
ncbi:urease accessory protein UreF [Actinomycetospora termitidis]|uniref:Urease accessory UreF family protein n=1 Tax=Actinomycetospora termitidis TaxID=3053470 RepID=A0ABT7MD84_9PSEU|nr:urease accessory UreF family protein [Actinomycetospora sp. Odt1-22]MDL5158620.1 urease accessory UreF family protein [Actinomycetospora sp. Odt1-22]